SRVARDLPSLALRHAFCCPYHSRKCWNRPVAASVLQASGLRRDVTVFRINAVCAGDSGLEPAFRRNEAAHEHTIEAAHNPEVAGSNPAPATAKGAGDGAFRFSSE